MNTDKEKEILLAKVKWEQIVKEAGLNSAENKAKQVSVESSKKTLVKTAGEVPFTEEELFALKAVGDHYNVDGSDYIEIGDFINVQKNDENDFSIYNKATQEYKELTNFNQTLELAKAWNKGPSA